MASSGSASLLAAARTDYARVKENLADIRPNDACQSKPSHCGDTKASAWDISSKLPRRVQEQAIENALSRLKVKSGLFQPNDVLASTTTASQDLLNQITVDIKLSGLRKAREVNLLGLLHRLKVAITDSESAQLRLVRSGRQTMADVAMAACRELECSDRRHQGALKALAARDAIIAKADLVHKDLEHKLRDKDADFMVLAEKLKAKADSRAKALLADRQQELTEFQSALDAKQKALLEEKEHLQGELRVADSTIRDLEHKRRIHENEKELQMTQQKNTIEDLRSKLDASESAVRERDRKMDSLCGEVKDLRSRLQDETDQLNAAEAKVKLILEKKEAKILALLQRAQAAEEELRSLLRV